MGAMGRYIDGLNDVERDRLIQAVGFCSCELRPKQGDACLVGTAEPSCPEAMDEDGGGLGWPDGEERRAAAESFDASFRRSRRGRGERPRIIRAIKARAAKNHRILLPAAVPQSETAGAVWDGRLPDRPRVGRDSGRILRMDVDVPIHRWEGVRCGTRGR